MDNRKPFDLKLALEGKKVVYRSGKSVSHIYRNPNAAYNVRVVTWDSDGKLCTHGDDGGAWRNEQSEYDLFMAPETKKVYVGVYHLPLPNKFASEARFVNDFISNDYYKLIEVIEREYEV